SFGHPHSFDGLVVGEGEQVADGSVGRSESCLDGRQSYGESLLAQVLPQLSSQGEDLLDGFNPLAVKSLEELSAAKRRLPNLPHEHCKFLLVKTKKRFVRPRLHASKLVSC